MFGVSFFSTIQVDILDVIMTQFQFNWHPSVFDSVNKTSLVIDDELLQEKYEAFLGLTSNKVEPVEEEDVQNKRGKRRGKKQR